MEKEGSHSRATVRKARQWIRTITIDQEFTFFLPDINRFNAFLTMFKLDSYRFMTFDSHALCILTSSFPTFETTTCFHALGIETIDKIPGRSSKNLCRKRALPVDVL